MKLRNLIVNAALVAAIVTGAQAANDQPRAGLTSNRLNLGATTKPQTQIKLMPDLVIQPRMKMSDIIGAPNTGFCGLLGGHVIVTFYVRNNGKAASGPTTAKLSFSNAYNFQPNFYAANVNVQGLQPGERDLIAYAIPNEAWQAHSNGNGYSAAFRVIVKAPEGEKVITNNWVKYHCIGGPV